MKQPSKIRFIPLASGSSGNCVFVANDEFSIFIDAGRTGKYLQDAMEIIEENIADLAGVFITHEHIDHIRGAGVLSRRFDLPIYASGGTWAAMQAEVGQVANHNIRIITPHKPLTLGTMTITAFNIPHDAAEPTGYVIESNGEKAVVSTDIGHISDNIRNYVFGADIILLESNHDLQKLEFCDYPFMTKERIRGDLGHLNNRASSSFAADLVKKGTKRIILGHLSENSNTPYDAEKAFVEEMAKINAIIGEDVHFCVAKRNEPTLLNVG